MSPYTTHLYFRIGTGIPEFQDFNYFVLKIFCLDDINQSEMLENSDASYLAPIELGEFLIYSSQTRICR